MGYRDVSSSETGPQPSLDDLLDRAWSNHEPIPIDYARDVLGDRFRESVLARETLIIRKDGESLLLAPMTWIRVLEKLKTMESAHPVDRQSAAAVADRRIGRLQPGHLDRRP